MGFLRFHVLVSCAALGPITLVAQLTPGTRVRLRAPTYSSVEVVGRVGALRADTIVLVATGFPTGSLRIPMTGVTRLEVSAGARRHTGTGARIGAMTFMIVGAVSGASSKCGGTFLDPEGTACEAAKPLVALVGGVAGAAFGALVGAGVGMLVRTEHWGVMPLKENQSILQSGPTSIRIGMSLSF